MKYIKTYEAQISSSRWGQKKEVPFIQFIQSAKRGSNSAVIKFIKEGVDVNIIGNDGLKRTALMWATINNFLLVVDTLIKAGANVNLQDSYGETALMFKTTQKILDKLLNAGANVNIQNNDGNTAIMLFLSYYINSSDKLINYLKKFLLRGLNLDIKNNRGFNFYENIKFKQENGHFAQQDDLIKIEQYINEKFPQYKEEWELKNAMNKYNL
jgi:ankyrin repeat protein